MHPLCSPMYADSCLSVIDGVDGGCGIGISREQDAPRFGLEDDGLLKKLGAAHMWHALVDEEQRDSVPARGQLAQGDERFFRGVDGEDSVCWRELRLQVALDRAEWTRQEPMILPARPGGRPHQTDMRAAMNVILHLLRNG